jgi:acyl-CoA thioester hydrolase
MDNIKELVEFPIIWSHPVQWGEQDAMGHVNGTVYFRWFENARIEFMNRVDPAMTMNTGGIGPILASIKCDYKLQVKYPDTIHLGTRVAKIGRSSVQFTHAVYSEQHQDIAATGDSTIVILNYESGLPQRVPDAMRTQIEKLQSSMNPVGD